MLELCYQKQSEKNDMFGSPKELNQNVEKSGYIFK